MKISFFSSGTYQPLPKSQAWPVPQCLYEPEIGVRAFERRLEHCVQAEELGFDWVSFSEHHYMPGVLEANPITIAAAVSQVTKRVKLAVLGPVVAFNNPIRIAEEIALLDNLSHGRAVVLLLRSGGFEFASYTANIGESRERTQEATEIILRALTEPQPFGWEGKHFRFRTIAPWPQSVQRPMPPMFYSGNSFKSAAFAAQHRLGLACSFYPAEYLATIIDYYRAEAVRAGWTPTSEDLLYRGICIITETDAEAEELAEGNAPSQAFGRIQWQGCPDSVVAQAKELHEIGIGTIDLNFAGGSDESPYPVSRQMKLFAQHVMPEVRDFGCEASGDASLSPAGVQ